MEKVFNDVRILILSSCTNKKAVEHPQQLTQADFERGPGHIAERERDLAEHLRPAQSLYLGQQHVRLMRGIEAASDRIDLDLRILSAGYGVIPGIRLVAPYEMTFSGMKKEQLKRWAALLEVPQEVRRLLSQSYDLSLILLGDDYLEACALDSSVELGGPTILSFLEYV